MRFYPPEQCLCHNLVRGLSGIECPSTRSSKCNKIPISFFLFTTLKGSSTLKQARRCLPIRLSFLSSSFYSTAMFLGLFFLLLFCAVTEIRTARGGGGGRELFQGAAVICSVLIPWLGGGKVFLSALLEGHILNIEKQREEED